MPTPADTLVYTRADGTRVVLVPQDQRSGLPANRDIAGRVYLDRTGAAKTLADCGVWVPEGDPSILKPAPVVVPPVVAKPVPQVPTLPPVLKMTMMVAPATLSRGIGVTNRSLADTVVKGFEQNIVVEKDGDYSWSNVQTTDAWRDDSAQGTEGQGLYLDAGTHAIAGLYAARNGWQDGQPARSKNVYRHNVYWNTKAKCRGVLTDLILSKAASVGGQFRSAIRARRVFCHRNAIGLLLIYGPHVIDELTVYGGSYQFDGTNWTANIGIDLYGPLTLTDACLVGGPAWTPPAIDGARVFNGAAISLNRTHRQYPDTPGGSLVAKDVVIANWAGGPFGGDAKPQGLPPGVTVRTAAVDVDAQVNELLAAIEAGKFAVAGGDAYARLSRVVRDAVK